VNGGPPELLFAHAYMVSDDPRPLGHMHPLPPLHPAEVAAWVAREAAAAVEVWDPTFRLGTAAFDVEVSRRRPRAAWIHSHPTTRAAALSMIAHARKAGAVIVVGGPDAQVRPGLYLQGGADAVVPHEGEEATHALLLALRAAQFRASPELLSRVPGLVWMDDHGTVRTSAGKARLPEVGRLPRPLREPQATRIHLERWLEIRRYRPLAVATARGCPLSCGFCSNSVFGRPYRRRDPREVVAEMRELLDTFDVDRFLLTDEVFLFDRHWLREFAAELRALGGPVPFEATAHPAHVDPQIIRELASVGLLHLELDAASGSDALLRRLDWSYRPSDVYRAATSLREAGVGVGLRVMAGLPEEERSDLDATMEMVEVVQPHGVEVTRVDPGSPALFRKDWERIIEGPCAERARRSRPLPHAVLEAAVAWMQSVGRAESPDAVDRVRALVGRARRPMLRALVRALPARRLPARG
jgi:radical SAM superfamily enzyme YgiQ (UPF0313 family)